MSRVFIVASYAPSLVLFRSHLIETLKNRGHQVLAAAPDNVGVTAERVRRLGAEPIDVPLQRTGLNPLADAVSISRLRRVLRQQQPDVVLAYTIKPICYSALAGIGLPFRYFAMVTGLGSVLLDRTGPRARVLGAVADQLYRLAAGRAERVIFQNRDDMAFFLDRKLLADRERAVVVDGSGVDTDYFKPVALPDEPVFLLIGRLIRDKGVYDYVAAARKVKAQLTSARFLLVGWIDGRHDAVRKEELEAWQQEGLIEYVGAVEDVRLELARCRVYVLPSYGEGTPRTVLEAMSMGRPIITTDSPGCREPIIPGENGLLVPPRDPDALCGAMMELAEAPTRRVEEMGRRGREIALDRYEVTKVTSSIIAAMRL